MQINIYKDPMQKARLFGAPVLYSAQRIPREDVPQGWYCYDLRGAAEDPDRPYSLVDLAEKNLAGSVLSYLPLKNGRSQNRLVKDMFQLSCVSVTLKKFCSDEKIHCPETPVRYMLRPASTEEAGLFYTLPPEKDEELGAIGHVRMDFGQSAKGFYHTWWPRGPEELNTPEFREELGNVIDDLRKGVLRDLVSMRRFCQDGSGAIAGSACCQNYGFTLETDRYFYRLRCNPAEGDYQAYLACFDKQAQKQAFGLTEKGCQALQDAADSGKTHRYSWYVIEHINNPKLRMDHSFPLEMAIQLYADLDCEDKRLGVTKDGISSVDLAICWGGREWISEDRLKSESFRDDLVVADAAAQIQQMLDTLPAVGRVSFASGEQEDFTDPQKFLETIREELPYHATSGFRYEVLTQNPDVRKAADDMLYDLYGEENPRSLEDYSNTSMTMEGLT